MGGPCKSLKAIQRRKKQLSKYRKWKRKNDPEFRKQANERSKLWRMNPENRERANAKRRLRRSKKSASETYLKEREQQKEYYRERRDRRKRLLEAMTPKQQIKFLANEKQIKIEKARLKRVNEILARQQAILDEHKQKVSKAKELQMKGLELEKQKLNLAQLDRVIAKLESMKESRMARYRASRKSPRDRYLWAIDYYYQLIEESKPLLQAA
jgi:hypothetical protein